MVNMLCVLCLSAGKYLTFDARVFYSTNMSTFCILFTTRIRGAILDIIVFFNLKDANKVHHMYLLFGMIHDYSTLIGY